MDKNFVNIDDLVRQRLEGREEQQPPGAWMRMSELLDKEMPHRRGAFLYWRRFFNVTAIALMTTSIAIGGYHLATSHGNAGGSGSSVAAGNETNAANEELPVVASSQPVAVPSSVGAIAHEAAAAPAGNVAGSPVAALSGSRHQFTDTHVNVRARNNDALMKMLAQNGIDLNRKNSDAGNGSTPDRQLLAMNEKFNSYNDNHYKAIVSGTSMSARHAEVKVSDAPLAATASNICAPHNAIATYRRVAGNTKHVAANTAAVVASTASVQGATGNEVAHMQPVAAGSAGHSYTSASGRHRSRIAANRRAGHKGSEVPASGSLAAAAAGTQPAPLRGVSGTQPAAIANTENMASTGTSSVAASTINKVPAGNSVPVPGAAIAATAPAATTLPKDAQPATRDAMQQASVANISKGKKVMEKMVLFEHYIKTTPSEGYYKLDTISYETFTRDNGKTSAEELALTGTARQANNAGSAEMAAASSKTANTTSGTPASSKGYKKGARGQSANSAGMVVNSAAGNASPLPAAKAAAAGNADTEETNGEENVNNENVFAAAAGSAVAKPGLLANEQAKKNNTGFSTMEKLAQTFNDVKVKALGARFVPGLTAGVSATFFGPASFKGFHFGATGTLVFDDILSLQAELKYFHRINSNFAIDDNYYTYTPVGSGQFAKQEKLNSYGFSSLQSIEIPISLRYRRGNFTIFAGANLVYTFAINTGAASMPSNTAPVMVSAQGNDNQPKLGERDFESRFGVGYLFGFAYEVSPNVTIDLRSVQTVWDNAGTSGAQSISSQLYKNPSVQLSFGYKFVKRAK